MAKFEVAKVYDNKTQYRHIESGVLFIADNSDKEVYHLSFIDMSWEESRKLDLAHIENEYKEYIKNS